MANAAIHDRYSPVLRLSLDHICLRQLTPTHQYCFQQPEDPRSETPIDQNSQGVNLSSHTKSTNRQKAHRKLYAANEKSRLTSLHKPVPRFGCHPPISVFALSHTLSSQHTIWMDATRFGGHCGLTTLQKDGAQSLFQHSTQPLWTVSGSCRSRPRGRSVQVRIFSLSVNHSVVCNR